MHGVHACGLCAFIPHSQHHVPTPHNLNFPNFTCSSHTSPNHFIAISHPKAFDDSATRITRRSISICLEKKILAELLRRSIYNSGQLFRDIFKNRKRLWSFDFRCFSLLPVRKEKHKAKVNWGHARSSKEDFNTLLSKLQSTKLSSNPTTFGVIGIKKNSRFNARIRNLDSHVMAEAHEAYKGEDKDEDPLLIRRELSNFDLQDDNVTSKERYETKEEETEHPILYKNQVNNELEDKKDGYNKKSVDTIEGEHNSDLGIGKVELWASPKFKMHFSDLDKFVKHGQITHHLLASKSKYFENFQELSPMVNLESPRYVMSHNSADRVLLKRHSSSQALPFGSKKLWWKMIMWSHRNINRTFSNNSTLIPASATLNSGYSSDTLEPKQGKTLRSVESSEKIITESFNKRNIDKNIDNQRGSRFKSDQRIAFLAKSSSFSRVDAWLKGLEIHQPLLGVDFDYDNAKNIAFPPSPDTGRSMMRTTSQLTYPNANVSKETLTAISVVQSLNLASNIGINAIPAICHLSNLRSVNLSNNFIVHILPGFLPKGIQTLNLSKNKINTIDGLRELNKLRILDLSYNRISRIGQGLSSCTLIKELYLMGNKISDVEGLHRLSKLTILDLSFNNISTTKALGQLVTNYDSLKALSLLGNPIQRNISNYQLNKVVYGLLPKLVYLNKQPLKTHRTREILSDSIVRAALGNNTRSNDKRSIRRVGHGGSSVSKRYRRSANGSQKSTNRTRK
ncbi:hypothetical protein VNO78_31028 [Psophocarpus tetragonolobus]|uniref:Uncharacterized protein n=1 Tax=Psophocarpus tetragonolobus TaxID=3891 RepID=A0AAN9RY05_PSOTE